MGSRISREIQQEALPRPSAAVGGTRELFASSGHGGRMGAPAASNMCKTMPKKMF